MSQFCSLQRGFGSSQSKSYKSYFSTFPPMQATEMTNKQPPTKASHQHNSGERQIHRSNIYTAVYFASPPLGTACGSHATDRTMKQNSL